MKTVKLYDVPRGSKIRVMGDIIVPPASDTIQEGDILKFSRIDGMYSECYTELGVLVHLSASADVEIV